MAKHSFDDWLSLQTSLLTMGLDAAFVIWARSWRIAMGGEPGARESRRMVEEKLIANMTLGMDLAAGKLGNSPDQIAKKATQHYSRKVKANRNRLMRAKG